MSTPDQPRGPEAELPPVDELDELASALLDGEAGDADRARLSDPALRAEVERRQAGFERVRAALSAPVAVDADARDAAIAAALAAADGAPAAPATDELAARRAAAGRGLRLVGVAAAVVAVLAIGVSVLAGSDGSDDASSFQSIEASLGDGGADDAGEAPAEADASTEEGTGEANRGFAVLGDFDSVDALLDEATGRSCPGCAVGGEVAPTVSDVTESGPEPAADPRCGPTGDQTTLFLLASVDGTPVEVWLVDGDVVVLDAAGCDELGRTTP